MRRAWGIPLIVFGALVSLSCSDDNNDAEPGGEQAVEVFSFVEHDLCEWVSDVEVAEWVAAEFDWDGVATGVVATDPVVGCEWTLEGAAGDTWVVTVGDASLWQDFSGRPYDFEARMTEVGVTEYPPPAGFIDIGAWVAGHPALSDGVVVHNGGFGQFAFGVPPGPWLQVSILTSDGFDEERDGGVASEEWERHSFAVADRFLQDFGWVS